MKQVLIADDEPSVIQSLVSSIDWRSLGLQVSGTASSGQEALEILRKQPIDIAILDIRMPGLSGLELCRKLHEQNRHIQTIIISGYAEFSYAQKAIRYGVTGYCLKPVEYEELTIHLRKAVYNLTKETSSSNRCDAILDAIEAENTEEITFLLKQAGLRAEKLYIAVSSGDSPIIEEELPGALTLRLGRSQYGYLSEHMLFGETAASQYPSKAAREFSGLGFLTEKIPPPTLKTAFDACSAMAMQYFIDPACRVCSSLDSVTDTLILSELSKAIGFSNRDKVLSLLSDIQNSYSRRFNIRSALQLCNMVISSDMFPYEKNDYYIYSIKQLVSEYGSFQEMTGRLAALLETVDDVESPWSSISNTSFLKLMKYINNRYNQDISLADTAAILNMNPNYLSQMFKKETGVTFTHYICDLRISEAKKLLRTTDHAISDIAMNVGFNDYFYFLKTFKKMTGKTPSQWRLET